MLTIYGKQVGEPRWPTMFILHLGLAKKIKNATQKEFSNPARAGGQALHTNDNEPKSVPKSESIAGSASTSDNDSEKKKKGNNFLPQWLKTYGRLKYDENKNSTSFWHFGILDTFYITVLFI